MVGGPGVGDRNGGNIGPVTRIQGRDCAGEVPGIIRDGHRRTGVRRENVIAPAGIVREFADLELGDIDRARISECVGYRTPDHTGIEEARTDACHRGAVRAFDADRQAAGFIDHKRGG